jgi:hypothetical protein
MTKETTISTTFRWTEASSDFYNPNLPPREKLKIEENRKWQT